MDVEKLEKEVEMGHGAQKKSWWAAALSVTGSNGRLRRQPFRQVKNTARGIWSSVTGRHTRTDDGEGYVPLQTVEPAA